MTTGYMDHAHSDVTTGRRGDVSEVVVVNGNSMDHGNDALTVTGRCHGNGETSYLAHNSTAENGLLNNSPDSDASYNKNRTTLVVKLNTKTRNGGPNDSRVRLKDVQIRSPTSCASSIRKRSSVSTDGTLPNSSTPTHANHANTSENGAPDVGGPVVKQSKSLLKTLPTSLENGLRTSGDCNLVVHRPTLPSDTTDNCSSSASLNSTAVQVRSDGIVAKVGDVEREKEIERRMRELGLWDYKRHQEKRVADMLEERIVAQDGLTATLQRCRRRQRERSCSAMEEIRNIVQCNTIRNSWGEKVIYEVKVLMGSFTRDVAHMTSDNVVTVRGLTSETDVKLTKEVAVELPRTVDVSRLSVTYTAGVVKISAPYMHVHRSPLTKLSSSRGRSDRRLSETEKPQFFSVSPLYSLQQRLKNESIS